MKINFDSGKVASDVSYMKLFHVDKIVSLDPDGIIALVLNNCAAAKAKLGEHKAALADFDKALGLYPLYAEAYSNRAVTKGILGQIEEAIVDYDEAVKICPQFVAAIVNRAFFQIKIGNYTAASADYDRARAITDPEDFWTLNRLESLRTLLLKIVN